jgi:predicted ATP-binding protein involved in virulence
VAWYKQKMAEIGDAKFASQLSDNLGLIEAIRTAVRTVLEPTGWQELNWGGAGIVVKHQDGRELPLSALSDGVQNMIALVADLAHRCARLNPHLRDAAARDTAGIVLIDEIDMHLHPRWQQMVVDLVRTAFPAIQFIMSTHSPHVLSTVDYESIRIIRMDDARTHLTTPPFQTRGVESADVLSQVMGVDPIPQIEPARWLSDYRAMIQTGQHESPDGLQLFARIVSHFGEQHPVLEGMNILRRLQDFRKVSGLPPGQVS